MPDRDQLLFFAAEGDINDALLDIWARDGLKLIPISASACGPIEYASLKEIPNIGRASASDQNKDDPYLILDASEEPRSREIELRDGSIKFLYDHVSNPTSVVIKFGGIFEDCVIAGKLGTISEDMNSINIFNNIASNIRSHFKKIRSYYVGPAAEALMLKGFRLTTNVRSPVKYDLRAPVLQNSRVLR